MSYTLTISDKIYNKLEATATNCGLGTIEELLDALLAKNEALIQRRHSVANIKRLQVQLQTKYGQMPDSVLLIQEDRER